MRGSDWGIYWAVLVVGFTLFAWLESAVTGASVVFSTPITLATGVWGGSLIYHLALISGEVEAPQVLGYKESQLLNKCANVLLVIAFLSLGVKLWLS